MYTIVCIDDRNGTFFFGKRQSRDSVLVADVLKMTEGRVLRCSLYSAALFPSALASERFLEEAAAGDYCFCEGQALLPYREKTEGMILYRWNRHYPSDRSLDLFPLENGLRLLESVDFPGSSHEKITREVYIR